MPSRSLVRLQGEIDLATAPVLERRLAALVGEGARTVVVDLREVPFCDVPALNVLLRLDDDLRARGGRLRLLGPCWWLDTMLSALDLRDRLDLERPAQADPNAAEDAFPDALGGI